MDFNLNIPVKVVSGKNAVKNNAHLLSQFGRRCIIVTGGKSAVLSGALSDMEEALRENGIEYEIYNKKRPRNNILYRNTINCLIKCRGSIMRPYILL